MYPDGPLKPFYPFFIKVLPITWNNGWTPMQIIMKLCQQMNEMINYLNEFHPVSFAELIEQINKATAAWEEELQQAQNELQEQINGLNTDIGNLDSKLERYNTSLDAQIDQIWTEIENRYNSLVNQINDLDASVNERLNSLTVKFMDLLTDLKNYIDHQDTYTKEWVKIELQHFLDRLDELYPPVYNPTRGYMDSLQNTLNDLYAAASPDSITAWEYDSLELTAQEYDDYNLTAYQYDRYAKKYLIKDTRFYMYSPFTGEYVPIKTVIYELAQFHLPNAITAEGYDNKELTAQGYDEKELTAYQYDSSALTLL